jgi:hypothetical protein
LRYGELKKFPKNLFVGFVNLFFLSPNGENLPQKKTLFPSHHITNICDALPSSLMDSTMSPKVKTMKGEGIGARSLAHNISRVEGRVRALGWGLRRLISNSIIRIDMHKPKKSWLVCSWSTFGA